MSQKNAKIETEVNGNEYQVDVTFHYNEGQWSMDPTEGSDNELEFTHIWGVTKYIDEINEFVEVTEESEYKSVTGSIDFEDEFFNLIH